MAVLQKGVSKQSQEISAETLTMGQPRIVEKILGILGTTRPYQHGKEMKGEGASLALPHSGRFVVKIGTRPGYTKLCHSAQSPVVTICHMPILWV